MANNRMGRKTQQIFNWADRSQKGKGGRGNQRKSSSLRDPKWSNCFGLGSCHRSSCQRRPGRRNCNRFVKARYVAMRGIFQKPGLPKDEAFACLWVFDCLYDCICRPPELARTKVLCSFVPAWHCCTAGCYARCLGSKPPVGHQFVLGATKSTHVGAVVCVCARVRFPIPHLQSDTRNPWQHMVCGYGFVYVCWCFRSSPFVPCLFFSFVRPSRAMTDYHNLCSLRCLGRKSTMIILI